MNNETRQEKVQRVTEILKKHDIEINVNGCGCCESPWFAMKYKGGTIVADEDYFILEMIKDDYLE